MNLLNDLITVDSTKFVLWGLIFIIYVFVAGWALNKSAIARRFINILTRTFFYVDASTENYSNSNKLNELEEKLLLLEKQIEKKIFINNMDDIKKRISDYVDNNVQEIIHSKINQEYLTDSVIDKRLSNNVNTFLSDYLKKKPITNLILEIDEFQVKEEKKKTCDRFETTIVEQLRSAGRLKMVMINLFVIFNIGILLTYLFGRVEVSQSLNYSISALYISLATFIIYVYKSSNTRTALLLSLQEDSKKYYDFLTFLAKYKGAKSLSEHDVELIKILLSNRSEREKTADHPYEVILKGVTNSTVQFKGGKVTNAK